MSLEVELEEQERITIRLQLWSTKLSKDRLLIALKNKSKSRRSKMLKLLL